MDLLKSRIRARSARPFLVWCGLLRLAVGSLARGQAVTLHSLYCRYPASSTLLARGRTRPVPVFMFHGWQHLRCGGDTAMAPVLDIGLRLELFVDDLVIDQLRGGPATRTTGQRGGSAL